MFVTLIAAIAAASAAASAPGPVTVDGQCEYRDPERINLHRNILAECNRFERVDDGSDSVFTFSKRSWGPAMRFYGTISGNEMTVNSVALRSNGAFAAEGSCRVRYDGQALSSVTCIASAGSKNYAANFVASRI